MTARLYIALSFILFACQSPLIFAGEEISFDKETDRIKQIDRKELDALSLEAELSAKSGDESAASAAYDKIISYYSPVLDNPRSDREEKINALRQIAIIKAKKNEFEDAITLCRKLKDEYPDEPAISIIEAETRQSCALFYLSKEETDSSIKEDEAILNLDDLPEEWYAFTKDNIAHAYILKQDPDKAIYWYNRIVEDHPRLNNWPACARFSIANYYLSHNDIPKAKDELKIITEQYPDSCWANPARNKLATLE